MATKSLEQIVNTLINPVKPEGINENFTFVSGNNLLIHLMSDLMRDVPLRTSKDVALWVIAAHSISPEITGTYTYANHNGDHVYRDLSMWDVQNITIDGLCASFEVSFCGMEIMYVTIGGKKIHCDCLTFHKGDFLVSNGGRNVFTISGVW